MFAELLVVGDFGATMHLRMYFFCSLCRLGPRWLQGSENGCLANLHVFDSGMLVCGCKVVMRVSGYGKGMYRSAHDVGGRGSSSLLSSLFLCPWQPWNVRA